MSAVTQISNVDVFKVGKSPSLVMVQPSTGMVAISCPWDRDLNGCHYWSHRGNETIYEFIIDLHREYAVGKLFGDMEEFDQEGTAKEFRAYIIERRRDKEYDEEKARELWDEVGYCESPDDFCRLDIPDAWESLQHRDKPCVEHFWREIWTPFIEHVKNNIICKVAVMTRPTEELA